MSLDRKINRIQFLSGNSLKVIAVLTMLIDHLCKIVLQWLLSNYWGAMADNGQMSWERFREIDYFIRFDLQSIGTIAFPLFCFLLAEGFQHTRSKKRYIGLMLAFALISEVPFDIGFFSAYSRMEDTFPFYLKYEIMSANTARKGRQSMENNLTYTMNGDYMIPDLKIEVPEQPLGKYGRMRQKYLKEHRPILWNQMILEETLFPHLLEIEQAAQSRLEQMMPELAAEAGATEALKASDPMKWVGLMNTCKAQAEEVILAEMIYA